LFRAVFDGGVETLDSQLISVARSDDSGAIGITSQVVNGIDLKISLNRIADCKDILEEFEVFQCFRLKLLGEPKYLCAWITFWQRSHLRLLPKLCASVYFKTTLNQIVINVVTGRLFIAELYS
jgi:hypothetical protein